MDNKKLIRIIAIVAIVAVIAVVVYLVVDNAMAAKAKADYAQQQRDTVVLVVDPIAKSHGINDLDCTYADFPPAGSVRATLTSEDFAALSDEAKLLFLSEAGYFCEMVPYDPENRLVAKISTDRLYIKMECPEGTYTESIENGISQLCLEDEVLFSAETPRSIAVKKELAEKESAKHNKDKGCKRCGEEGVTLTGGGYCKRCVDIYYTDYYIDLDGQISADRPY